MESPQSARRVWVIDGHPRHGSLGAALAQSYAEGAAAAGHPVRLTVLRDQYFNLNQLQQAPEPDLLRAREDLLWSEHVVVVHPIWWGTAPALLKGFWDRLLSHGFAFEEKPDGGWRGLLGGRGGEMISTLDTPVWIYRYLLGAPGVKALKLATFGFCGIKPVHITLLGPVRASTDAQRDGWIRQVRQLGAGIEHRLRTGRKARTMSWLKAARLQFYPFPLMVLTAGGFAAAVESGSAVIWGALLLAAGCAVLIEFITVLTNELQDQKTDAANLHHGPFTGGSRVLIEHKLGVRHLRQGRAAAGALLAVLTIGSAMLGPGNALDFPMIVAAVLILGLCYSAPPVRLASRGWGEVDVAFTHSFAVILLGYVSQGGQAGDRLPWLMGIPVFAAVLPSIILAGFPDWEADAAAGKKTLVVRLGRERALVIAMGATVVAVAALLAIAGSGPASAWLTFAAGLHGIGLCLALMKYRMKPRPGKIDGLLVLALSFMLWFGLEPLLRFASMLR